MFIGVYLFIYGGWGGGCRKVIGMGDWFGNENIRYKVGKDFRGFCLFFVLMFWEIGFLRMGVMGFYWLVEDIFVFRIVILRIMEKVLLVWNSVEDWGRELVSLEILIMV